MLKAAIPLVFLSLCVVSAQLPPWSDELAAVRKHYVRGENALLASDKGAAEKEFAKAFEKASDLHRRYPDEPELDEFVRNLQTTFEQLQLLHEMAIIAAPHQKERAESVAQELPKIDLFSHSVQIAPALVGRIQANLSETRYDLPVTLNEDVLRAMDFFLKKPNGRRLMRIGLERIGLYEEYIRETFRRAGLPADLVYLAQLESNFSPNAVSSAEAVGLWQFVADTGLRYGLKLDWWVDERVDPYKSTLAAASYLKSLYDQLGDWYLVLGSYNAGEGRILPLVEKGLRDFWAISQRKLVPRQTREFVPLVLAIAIIAKNPAEFGFEPAGSEPRPFDTIEVKRPVSLKVIARRFGIDLDELRDLNPELKQDITPQYLRSYTLRLPAGWAQRVATRLATLSARERMGN